MSETTTTTPPGNEPPEILESARVLRHADIAAHVQRHPEDGTVDPALEEASIESWLSEDPAEPGAEDRLAPKEVFHALA